LAGKDNFEQAKVDAVADTIFDILMAFVPTRQEQDESKKQEITKKFLSETLPKYLQNLDVLSKLYGNGGPYFVGNNLTWADLYFYDMGENLLSANPNSSIIIHG